MLSKETVVLITLPKRDSDNPANVVIRGVGSKGHALRPQVRIVEGRMFRPGSSEIVAGRSIADRFEGAGVGDHLRFAMRDWTVVGVFDANKSGFDSEIWGDADQLMQAFRRPVYSSIILQLNDASRFDAVKARLEGDQRLTVEAKRESVFYAEQSEVLANFIGYLGLTLSVIFSIGATIGAMITMYASVANRTSEIGTLRALGFRSRSILAVFLAEVAAPGPGWRDHRTLLCFVHAVSDHFDDELAVFRRTGVQLHAQPVDRHQVAAVCLAHGIDRRLPAGHACGKTEYRRRAEGALSAGRSPAGMQRSALPMVLLLYNLLVASTGRVVLERALSVSKQYVMFWPVIC